MQIRTATSGDIDAIMDIARGLTLSAGDSRDSFLVSNFSRDDYKRFLSHRACQCLVAEIDDTLAGFLIGYDETYARKLPDGSSESVILKAIGDDMPFQVIKQVGVSEDHAGQGVARALYEAFFDRSACDFVFAGIVEKPSPNTGSMKFHEKMGFFAVLQSSPPNPHYEDRIINQIWVKQMCPRVYTSALNEGVGGIGGGLAYLSDLYRHEDVLNWTKLGMLLTLLFALLTAAWVILEAEAGLLTGIASPVLILLGAVTLVGVKRKIDSGQRYMTAHKTALRLAESARALRDPAFLAPLWHVPRESTTSGWVKRMPELALFLWFVASSALVFKALKGWGLVPQLL